MPRHAPLLIALAVLLAQLLAFGDYFTDDSYIYARFASNLVAGDGLVFNPGERIHAATSPAWALLTAGVIALGLPVVSGMKLLGALFAAGALVVLGVLARRRYEDRTWVALALLLLATEPWFVRWSASGMETPLAGFLLLLALDASLRAPDAIRWSRLGWSVGWLPLVRPEALLLVGLIAAAALLRPGARGPVRFWAGLLMPMVVWSAFAMPYYGHILPATLQAKSTPLGLVPLRFAYNVGVLAQLFGLALLLPTAAWLVGCVRDVARREVGPPMRLAWLAWTVGLPVVYLLRDVQVVSRYLEMVLPAVLILGIDQLSRWPRQSLIRACVAVQIVGVTAFTVLRVMPSTNSFGRSLTGILEMGEWLREETGPDTVIAAYDIGALGYSSDREILDLGGLVHPGINELRNRVDDARILHEGLFLDFGAPDYLVDRDPDGAVLEGRELGEFHCEVVMERGVENLGISRPEPVTYVLYRLCLEDCARPRSDD